MRVLITTDAVGGVWQYSTTLAHMLANAHGVQILLAVCGQAPSEQQRASLRLGQRPTGGSIEMEEVGVPLEWQGGSDQSFARARRQILELALGWGAQVVHANEHHLGEIGSSGMPVLVVSHSDLCSWRAYVKGEATPMVEGNYVHRVKVGLATASAVVAPSTFVADSLCRWFGYSDVVRIIPNGVSAHPSTLTPTRTIDAMMAGRLWDPAKNLTCFQEAVSGMAPRAFVAAGSLSAPGASAPVPASGAIQYPGELPHIELRQTLARTRLCVSPAHYDPFGLVPVEAAMAGCCLVLSDIPSYRALWADAAIYFNPKAPEELRALIIELLGDAERRQALASAAREHARVHYTAERMVGAYLTTYQRLALRHGLAP